MSGISGMNNEARFEQLMNIAYGTVGKGEIVFEKKTGKFEKINNHVFLNLNFWRVSPEKNRATREAIYKVVAAHMNRKYGAENANIVLRSLHPYLLGKDAGQKVSRGDIRRILDIVEDKNYVESYNFWSKRRTRNYNELAEKISNSGIPYPMCEEIKTACCERLLRPGIAHKALNEQEWKLLESQVDDLVASYTQKLSQTYQKKCRELLDGIKDPFKAIQRNFKLRCTVLDMVQKAYGQNSQGVDEKYKLSPEENLLLGKRLTGIDVEKAKSAPSEKQKLVADPLPPENRRQLVEILEKIPSGAVRLAVLKKWPCREKTENVISNALGEIKKEEEMLHAREERKQRARARVEERHRRDGVDEPRKIEGLLQPDADMENKISAMSKVISKKGE